MREAGQFGELEINVRAIVRACREEDLRALEWMGLYSGHRKTICEAFEAQQRGEGLMLLAISAGFPIAQVWMRFGEKGRSRSATLWAVRTFFPLQGAGVGKRMMRITQSILARRGIRRAELVVAQHNRRAVDFYRALGWHEAWRGEETADRNGHVLMAKDIEPA